jgi:hypothetical protein
MAIDKILGDDALDTVADSVFSAVSDSVSEIKAMQKRKAAENVQVVIQALRKIESDIQAKYDGVTTAIEQRVASIRDGRDGRNGIDGRNGRDGLPGKDGLPGPRGLDGQDGINGLDGADGVSVIDARIDFDGSLVISLSNGREINVGEVVPLDLAERIKVITNGGGTSQSVLDTLESLQDQIDGIIVGGLPSQTGNAGKFLTTDGTDASWATIAGGGDVVGPASATDNAIARFDSTTGKLIQNSVVTMSDAGAVAGVTSLSSPDFIQFDTTATVTDATGRLYYNDEDMYQTLAFQMNGNVIQHVGEEIFYRVRLSAAATKGQVLMFTGTLGSSGGLTAAPATGLTFDQSNYLLGIAGESGSTNDWITVYEFGEVKEINTSAFTQGQVLYYDPAVTGGLTATKPNTPNAIATIAAVVHVGTSNGVLFVRPTFGSALGGTDGNVRFGTLASGNTIIYDAVDGVWKNANLTAGTGITITNAAGSITIAASGGATGDVVGPASSTDNAVARFDGTTGKLVQNSSFVVNDSGEVTTGVWKGTEITVPYGGTGVSTLTGIVKGNGASAFSAATAGTDYLEPPSGTAILKANSGGALANATAGTDYLAPPSGTALLKANSGGALANATAGTDYVTPTGTETLTNKTLTDPAIIGTILEDIFTITDGAEFEIDPGNGSVQLITLGANRTPKATNFVAGEAVTLMVDDGTAYTITWTDATWGGSGVIWATDSGVAPTLATAGYTTIILWKVSTQVYGARVGNA